MRSMRGLIGLLGTALLLAACAHPLAPPPPLPGAQARLPEIGETVLALHASVAYADMGAEAERAVAAQVVDMKAVNLGHGVTFQLTGQRSAITVAKAGDGIGFRTPFHIEGVLDSRCVVISHCYGTLTVDGKVWGQAQPILVPDWTFNLRPTGGFDIDAAKVHVAVFPADISIRPQVEKALKKPFDKLIFDIDDAAARTTLLKDAAGEAWAELAHPIQVSADPPVWLAVHPTRILARQPVFTERGIELDAALLARPELVVGARPPDADPGPLPGLNLVPGLPDQFSVYLPVRLSWEEATALARQNLEGRELPAGGGVSVRIEQVSIFDNGDEAGVKVGFHLRQARGGWAPEGTVYLLGRPVYHLEDGYISIEHLHVDVRTRDLVLKLAAWLTQASLIDDLQSRLRFDMRAQVAARRQALAQAITSAQLNPRVSLAGEVTSLAPSAVYLTSEGLQVNVVALGRLSVTAH